MNSINYISLPSGNFKNKRVVKSGISFLFDDDIQTTNNVNPTVNGLPSSTKVSDIPITALSKPASCVVTKNLAKAELITTKTASTPYREKNGNFNGLVDQIFEINYDVTITNCNLVSKYSDLQLENINLLETIAKIKNRHSQEITNLQEALKKAKNDNYEMNITNSDLTLSNVDFRKELFSLQKENCRLKQNQQIIGFSFQDFSERSSQDFTKEFPFFNEDLSVKLQHSSTETNGWEIGTNLTKRQQDMELSSYRHQVHQLTNENIVLTAKLENLESSYQNDYQKFLKQRLQELKELKEQFSKDVRFIENARQLQVEKENYLSTLINIEKDYDGLKKRFKNLQSKNFDTYCSNSTNESSSASLVLDNDIFDKFTPQTNTTERTSRWKRFYRKGGLSPSSWSLRLNNKTKDFFSLLAN